MSTSIPTKSTAWASDAGADKMDPGVGVQTYGLPDRAVVPNNLLNGHLDNIDAWVAYLRSQGLVFDDIGTMMASSHVAEGDLARIRGQAAAAPLGSPLWVKTTSDVGAGGTEEANVVATDGWRVFVGTDKDIYAFDARTGDDVVAAGPIYDWLAGGYATTVLAADGAWVYASGNSYVRLYNPTLQSNASTGAHYFSSTVPAALCVDGQHVYFGDTGGRVKCFEDLFDTPSLKWEDTTTLLGDTLNAIATNGVVVAVGHAWNGDSMNVTVLNAENGAVLYQLALDSGNTPDVSAVWLDRHHLWCVTSNGKLYRSPAHRELAVDPVQVTRASGHAKAEVDVARLQVSEHYLAQASVDLSNSSAVCVFPKEGGAGGDLMPCWSREYTTSPAAASPVKDIALGPDFIVVATKALTEDGTANVTVACYKLPSATKPLSVRKALSTDRYRAPFYGVVVEE